jgi:hypothetical protein
MSLGSAATVLAIVVLGAAPGAGNPRPISEAENVVAIYTQDRGLASAGSAGLILAAWSDGRVVWSEDRVQGGPPYLAGQLAPGRVAAVLDRVERDGAFDDKRLAQACFGPDAKYTTILVRKGARQLKMESWHEWAEAGGRLVSRSCALSALSGEKRLQAVRKESADDLYYRLVWSELRELSGSLVPSKSRAVSGEVMAKGGVLSWQEK